MSDYVNVKIPINDIPKWFVVANEQRLNNDTLDFIQDKYKHMYQNWEANWYVSINDNHPYYGLDYDTVDRELIDKANFYVHWWLTFGEHLSKCPEHIKKAYLKLEWTSEDDNVYIYWFDTFHLHDTPEEWPMDKVIEHTQWLRKAFFTCILEPRPLDKSIFDECWEKDE